MLEIRYDDDKIKRLERELRGFPRNSLPKVMSRSLNRTASQSRTTISRKLQQNLDVKRVKDIKSRISIVKATYRRWRAYLGVDTQGIYAYSWGAKKTKKGVMIRQGFTKNWRLWRHAFIATMPSGHIGVFAKRYPEYIFSSGRTSEGKRRKGRLPLSEVYGLSGAEFRKEVIEQIATFEKQINGILQKNINDQVNLILRRRLPA